jgi:hypothetical protein
MIPQQVSNETDIHNTVNDYINKPEISPATATCHLTDHPALFLPCPSKRFRS